MHEKHLRLQTPAYLPATEAAERFGLTNDHIASLCRRRKVAGELRGGRIWYVNEDSLQHYLAQAAEEKAARSRALSERIRREQAARAPQESPVGFLHMAPLALPLFLALAVNVPVLPAAGSALGAAVAGYEDALEIAVELQVDAYETLGAAAASIVAHGAAPQVAITPLPPPQLSARDPLSAGLERVPLQAAAATAGHTFELFELRSLALATEPVPLEAVVAEIPEVTAAFYEGLARRWIELVHAAGDAEAAAHAAAVATLYALADDMSAAVLLAIADVSYSVNAAALWYIDSSNTIYAKTQLH